MTESEFRDWVRGWLSSLDGRVKGFEGRPAGAAYPHPAFMEGLALLRERIEALEGLAERVCLLEADRLAAGGGVGKKKRRGGPLRGIALRAKEAAAARKGPAA